ncbi:hypothetical protein GQ44DRAFT_703666 [Phaeosphaeriaceae sp. PMI808]|nr:hypothetical protein GQ44DRAFT_703666 [Phaeosphaeriaceae sp. PMI808]
MHMHTLSFFLSIFSLLADSAGLYLGLDFGIVACDISRLDIGRAEGARFRDQTRSQTGYLASHRPYFGSRSGPVSGPSCFCARMLLALTAAPAPSSQWQPRTPLFLHPKSQCLSDVCVCVCVCVLLWPCTLWVWAVTMRQLYTLCFITLPPIQKPTVRPARPLPNPMLNRPSHKDVAGAGRPSSLLAVATQSTVLT